jgi:hypothetical protein
LAGGRPFLVLGTRELPSEVVQYAPSHTGWSGGQQVPSPQQVAPSVGQHGAASGAQQVPVPEHSPPPHGKSFTCVSTRETDGE